jgi:chloramphenicol 3-O phosphotransferase
MADSSPRDSLTVRPPGCILLLNGASSSGKSTLARMLQARMPTPFWHISIDHLRDSGVLPTARIRSKEFDWRALREPFFIGFERSLVAYAEAGNDLIVEHIMESEAWLMRLATTLSGLDVFVIGVHCPLEELERREIARGDRPVGDARRDFHRIHSYCSYDVEVDGTADAAANADAVIAAWQARPQPLARHPRALDRLRQSS